MDMVLNRNHTLYSVYGHSIPFRKGQPIWVPPAVVREAVAIGAAPSEGEMPSMVDEAKEIALGPSDPERRKTEIYAAFNKVIDTNTRDDFTAGGLPNIAALTVALGYEITAKERTALWSDFCEDKAKTEL